MDSLIWIWDFIKSVSASIFANILTSKRREHVPIPTHNERGLPSGDDPSPLRPSSDEHTKEHCDFDDLIHRILLVYEKHGINRTEIPRVTPDEYGITLAVLADNNELLTKLSPTYLDWLANTFGVRREWVEYGDYDQIYSRKYHYSIRCDLLKWILERKDTGLKAYAIKASGTDLNKKLKLHSGKDAWVHLLFAEPILKIGDKTVHRYSFVSKDWPWSHQTARLELKSIVRVCEENKFYFEGLDMVEEKMHELFGGKLFPADLERELNWHSRSWHIDDYVDTEEESCRAKETDELHWVFEEIEKLSLRQCARDGKSAAQSEGSKNPSGL